MSDKKFTWGDLKKIASELPEEMLNKSVVFWYEDNEGGSVVSDCEILDEDYLFDGDEGCARETDIRTGYDSPEEWEINKDEHYVVYAKGFPILHIPSENPIG